jgi:hypothetical protein
MSADAKLNEWKLLKGQFDALVHNEGMSEDSLEQLLDAQIRRRFGELIARAEGHRVDYGARPHRSPRHANQKSKYF